jgi:DNA-binding IclR family transcriptional regulator
MTKEEFMPTAGADSLRKSLRVLELVTSRRPLWSGAEVAKALDLPASTAHRILQAWCETGYLVRDEANRYGLGYSAVRLGENALATYDVRRLARPALESITARTGETSLLAIHDEKADRAVIRRISAVPQGHPPGQPRGAARRRLDLQSP